MDKKLNILQKAIANLFNQLGIKKFTCTITIIAIAGGGLACSREPLPKINGNQTTIINLVETRDLNSIIDPNNPVVTLIKKEESPQKNAIESITAENLISSSEQPIVCDVFNPMNDIEVQLIAEEIIDQISKAQGYHQLPIEMVKRIIYFINRIEINNYSYNTVYDDCQNIIKINSNFDIFKTFLESKDIYFPINIIPIEDMITNKEAHDCLEYYFASKESLGKEFFVNKDRDAILHELIMFSDKYYKIFIGEENFYGIKFSDIPSSAKFIMLHDAKYMTELIYYAQHLGLLENVNENYNYAEMINTIDKQLELLPFQLITKTDKNTETRSKKLILTIK